MKDWIRIVYYIVLLVLLVFILVRGGGDPCERCKYKNDFTNETMTCRDLIMREASPYLTTTYKNNSLGGGMINEWESIEHLSEPAKRIAESYAQSPNKTKIDINFSH